MDIWLKGARLGIHQSTFRHILIFEPILLSLDAWIRVTRKKICDFQKFYKISNLAPMCDPIKNCFRGAQVDYFCRPHPQNFL